MSTEAPKGPNIRELESLRIARAANPKKPSRIFPAAITLAILAIVGAAGYVVYQKTLGRPPEVQTAIVGVKEAGQAGTVLTGSGYIVTEHKYIVIGTKILGQIVQEPIEEGQRVKAGDLLARIDDRDYQAQLKQAYADRDLAKANVVLKAARAARLRTLYAQGVESKDSLDDAENQLSVAEADLKKSDGEIEFAKFNVSQTVITSPINGVVLQKYRELGDTINYGGEIQAGGGATDIAQLADLSDLRCEVDINESDIAKVKMGTPATVILDAYPDDPFPAQGGEDLSRGRPAERHGEGRGQSPAAGPQSYQAGNEREGHVPIDHDAGRIGGADGAGAEEGDRHRRQREFGVGGARRHGASGADCRGARVSGRGRGQAGAQRWRDGDRGAGGDDQGRAGSHGGRVVVEGRVNHLIKCGTRRGFRASLGRGDPCTR